MISGIRASGAASERQVHLDFRVVTEVNEVKADFKSKSYIALKEARESLYWIKLLHRNGFLDEKQYESIFADAEELVKILVARCKKLDSEE